jgi:hypothetical protein
MEESDAAGRSISVKELAAEITGRLQALASLKTAKVRALRREYSRRFAQDATAERGRAGIPRHGAVWKLQPLFRL